RRQNDGGRRHLILPVADERRLVALHRAVKIVELRVFAEACSVDLGRVGVGLRADDLRLLAALGEYRTGLLLARGPHAVEGGVQRRAVGKIGALDAYVQHLDTVLARDPVQGIAHAIHNPLPLGRQERGEFDPAELVANFGAEDRPQLRRELLFIAGADVHQQRIDDRIAREGVHLEAALVGRDHLLALHVDVLNALVDPDDLLDEGNAVGQSGAWRSADGPAWLVAIQDS